MADEPDDEHLPAATPDESDAAREDDEAAPDVRGAPRQPRAPKPAAARPALGYNQNGFSQQQQPHLLQQQLPPQQQFMAAPVAGSGSRKMRPQSAKTAGMSNQLAVQQQQSTQLAGVQWVNNGSSQHQPQLASGQSHQALLHNQNYPHNQQQHPQQQQFQYYPAPGKSAKRRPATGNAKNKPPRAQKIGTSLQHGMSVYGGSS